MRSPVGKRWTGTGLVLMADYFISYTSTDRDWAHWIGTELKAGALVFVGAKDVLFRPWPPEAPPPKKKKSRTVKKTVKKTPRRSATARERR